MKKIFKIFRRDLRTIVKNPAALIIAIGLCLLPSLYAWINIKACWDPYANTGNLPVAVVNNDEGAEFNNKTINVGNEIIKQLKQNKSIGWVFIDDWQGNYGLDQGKYYALIEIPRNFSKGLVSLTTVNPEKPYIVYRVNEKLNAIAAKITNVATSKLAENVKSNFVSAVNNEALKELKSLGNELKLDKAHIIQFKDTITESSDNIQNIKNYMSEANAGSESVQQYLNNLKSTLPKITDQINSLQKTAEASKSLVLATKESMDTTAADINNDMTEIQSLNQQMQVLLANLESINNSGNNVNATNTVNDMISTNDSLDKTVSTGVKSLEGINAANPSIQVVQLISSLQNLQGTIGNQKIKLSGLNTSIGNSTNSSSKEANNADIYKISALTNEIENEISGSSNSFYNGVMPLLNRIGDGLILKLNNIDSLLESTKVIVPQLNALANFQIANSKTSIQQANELSNRLTDVQADLNQLNDRMKNIDEENLDQIMKILAMNPDEVASFISSPIKVKEVQIYDSGIFGVGLTPFYTVLAIWVGALLLTSLLTVNCEDFLDGERLNLRQKHFGKMLLFLFVSIIQATIVTLGDKYILGVKPENMLLMLLFALLSSITFTIIIFTFVSVLGNVGKAIAVIIMVFQIAGSGGIYPIQTNPKIFGELQPLWPFTYAINGFREAIAGPIWPNVYRNIIALSIFMVIFLLLAILKRPFHKLTETMEHKFKESGL
ncbi:MAG: YhgE/Pip domain-containing protein [Bacillota bacterium]|nr:YhgE/Pip domain-containing protein [Bacillota bacterium]